MRTLLLAVISATVWVNSLNLKAKCHSARLCLVPNTVKSPFSEQLSITDSFEITFLIFIYFNDRDFPNSGFSEKKNGRGQLVIVEYVAFVTIKFRY